MKRAKRLFVGFLTLVMLLCAVPFAGQPVQAAPEADPGTDPYFEEIQCAMFPLNYMNITRTNSKMDLDQERLKRNSSTSGHRAYSTDFIGGDLKVRAPFDMKIAYMHSDNHMVVIESLKPVRFANGTVDYMTCMVLHDTDVSDLWEGKTFKQGEVFYKQGDYGDADGVHLHIEVAVGKNLCNSTLKDKKAAKNANVKNIRQHGIQVWDAFYLTPAVAAGKGKQDITVSYEGKANIKLDWKVRQEVTFHSNVSGKAALVRHYPVGQAFGSLPTPVNAGKMFDGWYTAQTGGTKVDENTIVTKNHVNLYARWKDIPSDVAKALTDTKITLKASALGQNDARLIMTADYGLMMNWMSLKVGFYIGTDPNYLTKCEKSQITTTGSKLKKSIAFRLGVYDLQLRPGTTYYYQFYATPITGEGEVRSKVASFKTPAAAETTYPARTHVEWRSQKASATTSTATISVKVNLKDIYSTNKKTQVDYAGFYVGTAKDKLVKSTAITNYNAQKTTFDLKYDLAKSGVTMQSGKTYFYQFYVVAGGVEYTSGIRSFKAKANATGTTPNTQTTPPSNSGQTTPSAPSNNSGQTANPGNNSGQTTPSAPSNNAGQNTNPGNSGQNTTPSTQTPALNPTWSKYKVDKVSKNNATIYATVTYGKKLKADYCGFYLGTTKDNLVKAKKNDAVTESRNYTDMWYDMNKYGFTLNADTTYYYQFYLIVDGVEYKSAVRWFTTAKTADSLNPVWSEHAVKDITKTNATFSCKVTYGKTVLLQKAGFYIGTSMDNLVKADKYDTANANRTYSGMSYNMNKYGFTLKAGTTYYYRFYVIIGGKEYLSDIRSFTTAK